MLQCGRRHVSCEQVIRAERCLLESKAGMIPVSTAVGPSAPGQCFGPAALAARVWLRDLATSSSLSVMGARQLHSMGRELGRLERLRVLLARHRVR